MKSQRLHTKLINIFETAISIFAETRKWGFKWPIFTVASELHYEMFRMACSEACFPRFG
jgi:hypothetical protein